MKDFPTLRMSPIRSALANLGVSFPAAFYNNAGPGAEFHGKTPGMTRCTIQRLISRLRPAGAADNPRRTVAEALGKSLNYL